MSKMSREDLFREIGEIDEAYVEEAQRVRRSKVPLWVKGTLTAAASLVLCVGVSFVTFQSMRENTSGGAADMAADMRTEYQREAKGADAGEECGGAVPEAAEDTACQEEDGQMELETSLEEASLEELAINQTQREPASQEYGQDKFTDDVQGQPKQETTALTEAEKDELSAPVDQSSYLTDEELLQSSGAPAKSLTWEEARQISGYGKYVDVQLPEGYSYTSGRGDASSLYVVWNKGMEEISISCHQADESVSDWLVDVENPQEYDLRLYSIPLCDSVPQELIQQVSNAVFESKDISLQIVEARSYQTEDSGDVKGNRTRIGILYSDNVLVEITGKGPSAEEIYALISSEN